MTNFMKWLFTYSVYACDFQAFSVDEVEGVQDVKYDGIKTGSGMFIRALFKFGYYKNGKLDTSMIPSQTFVNLKPQMSAIQVYDWHVVYHEGKKMLYDREEPLGTKM